MVFTMSYIVYWFGELNWETLFVLLAWVIFAQFMSFTIGNIFKIPLGFGMIILFIYTMFVMVMFIMVYGLAYMIWPEWASVVPFMVHVIVTLGLIAHNGITRKEIATDGSRYYMEMYSSLLIIRALINER